MILNTKWSQTRCSKSKGWDVNLHTFSICFPFLTFLISYFSFFRPAAAEPALSGWTACSSRMLLVLGQRLGFLYTPTTPFHQAGIPTPINQSGDSPWMSVNMFPHCLFFPTLFLFFFLCPSLLCSYDCTLPPFFGF